MMSLDRKVSALDKVVKKVKQWLAQVVRMVPDLAVQDKW